MHQEVAALIETLRGRDNAPFGECVQPVLKANRLKTTIGIDDHHNINDRRSTLTLSDRYQSGKVTITNQ